MSHTFIGLSIIMFFAKISTFPGILIKIMLVFGGFWKLRYGNILSKTYSTSQKNNYLAPFIIYISNSTNRQFMLDTITSSSPSSCHFFCIIEAICMTALQVLFIGTVILIGSIQTRFKLISNHTYHWIQDDGTHCFARYYKACHYIEQKFK